MWLDSKTREGAGGGALPSRAVGVTRALKAIRFAFYQDHSDYCMERRACIWGVPGGPEVRIPWLTCQRSGFDPWSAAKVPQAAVRLTHKMGERGQNGGQPGGHGRDSGSGGGRRTWATGVHEKTGPEVCELALI